MFRSAIVCFTFIGALSAAGVAIRWYDMSRMFRCYGLSDVVWSGDRFIAVGSMILTSTDGNYWRLADAASEKYLDWVVWTGDRFIAFGGGWRADCLTSPDGSTWTNHIAVGKSLYHAVWTGTRMVATGDSGAIFTSDNFSTWTKQSMPASAKISAVIWTGMQIVAVGDSGSIVTSGNLTQWTKQVSPTTRKLNNAVWTGTQVVAVGDSGTILTSPDGIAWTQRTVPTAERISDIVWTGTLLVATNNKNLKALTSPDGVEWKLDENFPRIQRIVRSDTRMYGLRAGYDSIYVSTDSMTWDPLLLPKGTSDLYGLACGNGRLVMVGDSLTVIGCDTTGKSTLYWKGGISYLNRINLTKKGYAAIGYKDRDSGTIITSRDGYAWRRYPIPTPYSLSFVTATDSLYIVGYVGSIFTSPDCITWTEKKFDATSLNDAVMTDSLLVVVGYYGRIFTSKDGVNWTGRTSHTIDELNCIIRTGSGFMIGTGSTSTYGASDCFLTSPDGITWTNHTRKPQGTILDIAWSGSTLVAVGSMDRILSTADFSEWKLHDWTRYNLQTLYAVEWTGREFVAAGTSDSVYTSPDGYDWTPHDMGRYFGVKSLLWADSMLFAAGGYDDSASLLIGTIDETPVGIQRQNATASRTGRNRTILYSGTFPPRITEGGRLYRLDGRRGTRIPPYSRHTPARGTPNGIWILQPE